MNRNIIAVLCLLSTLPMSLLAQQQFDGIVGTPGCKAIQFTDSRFRDWAKTCTVTRGLNNIAKPSDGYARFGKESNAVGAVTGTNTADCISLGDAGVAIVTFNYPIVDGEGFDFAVFENSFNDTFLELATVEVSSDGVNYFGFVTTSLTPTDKQVGPNGPVNATKINNLAGKYRIAWGTPFDIAEIPDTPLLNKNNITHVKIRDVIGTIIDTLATRDSHGNIINDPYPTSFPGTDEWSGTGGFDLSGVGVINNALSLSLVEPQIRAGVYPNPCTDRLFVASAGGCRIVIYNIYGQKYDELTTADDTVSFDLSTYPSGMYLVEISDGVARKTIKVIKQ